MLIFCNLYSNSSVGNVTVLTMKLKNTNIIIIIGMVYHSPNGENLRIIYVI